MSSPDEGRAGDPPPSSTRIPAVYARLAEEAELRLATRTPRPAVRWVGWALCLALAAGVAWAVGSSPW